MVLRWVYKGSGAFILVDYKIYFGIRVTSIKAPPRKFGMFFMAVPEWMKKCECLYRINSKDYCDDS